jgi:hypothetical protein
LVSKSHTLSVWSELPLSARLPSANTAQLNTLLPECPVNKVAISDVGIRRASVVVVVVVVVKPRDTFTI